MAYHLVILSIRFLFCLKMSSYVLVEGGPPIDKKYGRLLLVDFDDFLKNNGDIEMRVDNEFDSNEDYIEKISVISKSKMACALMSGKILIRNIISSGCSSITYMDSLTIPCPEPLQVVIGTVQVFLYQVAGWAGWPSSCKTSVLSQSVGVEFTLAI